MNQPGHSRCFHAHIMRLVSQTVEIINLLCITILILTSFRAFMAKKATKTPVITMKTVTLAGWTLAYRDIRGDFYIE